MDMCWEVRRKLLNGKKSTGSYKRESRMWAGKARDVWTHLSRKIVLADRYHIFNTDEKLNMFEFFCREYARLVRRYIDNREDAESMNAEVVSVDLINLMDEDESNGMLLLCMMSLSWTVFITSCTLRKSCGSRTGSASFQSGRGKAGW